MTTAPELRRRSGLCLADHDGRTFCCHEKWWEEGDRFEEYGGQACKPCVLGTCDGTKHVPELRLAMTCPNCGGDLEAINEASPTTTEHVSVWRCVSCRWQWSVRVDLALFSTSGRTQRKQEVSA